MGLFIGASILTILELFDYIYEVRFGIPLGEMTTCGALILPPRPEPKHLIATRACTLLLSMAIVCHQP